MGEWKYTEFYGRTDKGINEIRINNYKEAFFRPLGIFLSKTEGLYRSLFFEPFYQLMRLQLLAQEMECHHEMGADIVTVLHVSPTANGEFREGVTSEYLRNQYPGQSVMNIWKKLVEPGRFMSISVEDMLNLIDHSRSVANDEWVTYLKDRYTF